MELTAKVTDPLKPLVELLQSWKAPTDSFDRVYFDPEEALINDFFQRPYMIRQARCHRWRHPQSLVDSAEIVICEVNCDHRGMVLKLLGEGVCQARKSSHSHTHRQILAFHMARADVLRIGIAALERLIEIMKAEVEKDPELGYEVAAGGLKTSPSLAVVFSFDLKTLELKSTHICSEKRAAKAWMKAYEVKI